MLKENSCYAKNKVNGSSVGTGGALLLRTCFHLFLAVFRK